MTFRIRLQYADHTIKSVYFPESGLGSVVAAGNRARPKLKLPSSVAKS